MEELVLARKNEYSYYYGDCSEYCDSPSGIYTEFYGEIAIRQINVVFDDLIPSSKNDILYDGVMSDLDMSDSERIEKSVFERNWSASGGPKNILYRKGDASLPIAPKTVICHIVNNEAKWGKGFVTSLSDKYPFSKKRYTEFCGCYEKDNLLGRVLIDKVEENIYIANMFAQNGYRKSRLDKKRYVDYNSLKLCLQEIANFSLLHRYSIQMPRIGAGLGGGDWLVIENLVKENICYYGIDNYVIDPEGE